MTLQQHKISGYSLNLSLKLLGLRLQHHYFFIDSKNAQKLKLKNMHRDFYNSMAGRHQRPSPKFSLKLAQVTLPARGLGSYLLQHNSRIPWRRDIRTRLSVYLPIARVQPHPSPFPSSLREGGGFTQAIFQWIYPFMF